MAAQNAGQNAAAPYVAFDASDSAHLEFKDDVKEWLSHHENEQAIRQELSALLAPVKARKAELTERIMQFMHRNGWSHIDFGEKNVKVARAQTKRTESLKKQHILEVLTPVVGQRAEELLARMMELRQVTTQDTLKRTAIKGGAEDP